MKKNKKNSSAKDNMKKNEGRASALKHTSNNKSKTSAKISSSSAKEKNKDVSKKPGKNTPVNSKEKNSNIATQKNKSASEKKEKKKTAVASPVKKKPTTTPAVKKKNSSGSTNSEKISGKKQPQKSEIKEEPKKIRKVLLDNEEIIIPDEIEKEVITEPDAEPAVIDEVPIPDLDIPVSEEEDVHEDDLALIPEKKGRGRKKKNDTKAGPGKNTSLESYIRNRPLQIDVTKPLLKPKKEEQPKPFSGKEDNRPRYSDKELAEFKEIILKKLAEAQSDYEQLKQQINNEDDHGTDDTSPTFKLMEDGSELMTKEELTRLAIRQEKYIASLKNALIRIENKTYGICRATGKLIPKERLRIVPHATLSIDAKLNQND